MRATIFWEVENVKKIHVGNINDDWNKVVAFKVEDHSFVC